MRIEDIAHVCHEANRTYCLIIGDPSQRPWDQATSWQRDGAINGVRFMITNPGATTAALHDEWVNQKLQNGWRLGPVKDGKKKTHPCLLPFHQLPLEQQTKAVLFRNIVLSLQV